MPIEQVVLETDLHIEQALKSIEQDDLPAATRKKRCKSLSPRTRRPEKGPEAARVLCSGGAEDPTGEVVLFGQETTLLKVLE